MPRYRVRRLEGNPMIRPHHAPGVGGNVQGPSLVRVPDWVPGRIGRYYLYFADHKGDHIRLAFADALEGPWRIHPPGALRLEDSGFATRPPAREAGVVPPLAQGTRPGLAPPGTPGIPDAHEDATIPHIASPDVHVDGDARRFVMYFHGLESYGRQLTRVAVSADGLRFRAVGGPLGPSYFRAFRHGGHVYALAMPGILYRSADGMSGFERGPDLFGDPLQRHAALRRRGDALDVFWTRVGDVPERILVSTVPLRGPWTGWSAGPPSEVLRPERDWEGADLPLAPSYRSAIAHPVNQLRDPAILEDGGRLWLAYAVGGEAGIAIAELAESADD